MFRFLIPLLLLILLPDLYIWWNFTRLQAGIWRSILLFAPTILSLLCLLLLLCQVRVGLLMQVAFLLFICIAVPKLVFVIFDLLGRGTGFFSHAAALWFTRMGIIMAVLTASVQIYASLFGWQRIETKVTHIGMSNLPKAFEGYRIVQISDLHVGSYAGDDRFVRRMVDSVNAQKPDLIVFTGDIVNASSEELPPYLDALSRLKAKDGIYAILGNHDYCIYHPGLTPVQQATELRHIINTERRLGWQVLLNENRPVTRKGDTLYIAGVENIGKPPFPERGDLHKAMNGIPPTACTILLSHDPWHWRHGIWGETSVPLTLSGHTHALQMQIGSFSPAQWLMPEWGGLYRHGNQQLYVSTGIGGSVPYRLGAWPKVEVIILNKH